MAIASNAATEETVALALRELALSQGDQEGLSEFLTEYFTSDNHEFSSGEKIQSINNATKLAMIIIIESSDEESDVEWQEAQDTAPAQVSLQDSLVGEEQETSQPLVHNTAPVVEVQPNKLHLEREENTSVQRFLTDGCGCDLADGPCSSIFTVESVADYRGQCSELSRVELDMAILGQLSAFTNTSTLTVHSSRYRHSPANLQWTRMVFWHGGRRVCRKMFLFLHAISKKRLENLQESFKENGLAPRQHGNTHRLPANTISFPDKQRVVEFLLTYAEANAILLPGRIPGYKCTDVQLLPSSTTKRHVWQQYCTSLLSLSSSHNQVAYSTFCLIWRQVVPQVLVTKPMSDLCWICQSNSMAIMRASNLPEEQKSQVRHPHAKIAH